jgi:hypothetical protein
VTVGGAQCPCGEVHELSALVRFQYERVTAGKPAEVKVETPDGCYAVPRIFIACHGIRASELPELAERYGFEHC